MFTTTIFIFQNKSTSSLPPRRPLPEHSEVERYKRSFDLIFGIIVIILNAIQIIMICQIRRKKTIYVKYLLSLSTTDLLFGLSNVIVSAIYLAEVQKINFLLDVAYSVFCLCILTSIFHILWITLSRLLAVAYPFQHNKVVTHKRVHMLIILTWIFTLLLSAGILAYQRIKFSSASRSDKLENKVKLAISISILCADVVFIASYSFIIHRIRQDNIFKKVNKGNVYLDSEKRMLIVCILVASVFVLFTTPYALAKISTGETPFWKTALLVINSGVNSIAYFFRGRYQDWIKSFIRRKKGRSNEKRNVDSDVTISYSVGSSSLEIRRKSIPSEVIETTSEDVNSVSNTIEMRNDQDNY